MKNPMMQQLGKRPPQNMLQQFNQFKQMMQGKDPQAVVTNLLNSGKMSQQQFEELKAQADEMQKFFGG